MADSFNPDERPVGLTKSVGYEIGVRRTLPVNLRQAWKLITSDEGRRLWLGAGLGVDYTVGANYQLADGTVGEIRVFEPESHLRLTWRPPAWNRASTIQVRVIPQGERTAIAFHQEHLPDGAAREARRAHFKAALDELERRIG